MEDKFHQRNETELNILDQEEDKFGFEKSIEKQEVVLYLPDDTTLAENHSFVSREIVPLNYEIKAADQEALPNATASWTISGYLTIQNMRTNY